MSIVKCHCPSPHQDRVLGQGKRFANPTAGKRGKGSRCTVCGVVVADAERVVKKHVEDVQKA